jgi:RNA polymerase sigma-70 factor (ECF subfamily)
MPADELEALIGDYGRLVYRLAVAIVHDHGLAEDIVQDVMVKAWTASPRDDGSSTVRWLRVVTRNAAIDSLRRRRFEKITDRPPEPERSAPTTEQVVEGRHRLDAVWAALGDLDPEARTMLAMREAERLSYDEIANTLGTTTSAVKAKLYRARHMLRRSLAAWESDASL